MSNPKWYRVFWYNTQLEDDNPWLDEPRPYNTWSDHLWEPFEHARPGTADRDEAEQWAAAYTKEFGFETEVRAVHTMAVFEDPPDTWFVAYREVDHMGKLPLRTYLSSAISSDSNPRFALAFRTRQASRSIFGGRGYRTMRVGELPAEDDK